MLYKNMHTQKIFYNRGGGGFGTSGITMTFVLFLASILRLVYLEIAPESCSAITTEDNLKLVSSGDSSSCGCSTGTSRAEKESENEDYDSNVELFLGNSRRSWNNEMVLIPKGEFYFGTDNPKIPYVGHLFY